jgi:hypothetical protein
MPHSEALMRQVVLAILVACAAGCGGDGHVKVANEPPADMAEIGSADLAKTPVAHVSFHLTGVQ